MYWKRLRPYVMELLTFLAIGLGISFFFIVSKSIVIIWSTPVVLLVIVIIIWFVQYIFSFVPFSILVLTDALFRNYDTIEGTFIEQFVYKSSSFLDKNKMVKKQDGKRRVEQAETLYYKIVIKSGKDIYIFTSSVYFELAPNEFYQFVYGSKSKALVDVLSLKSAD